MKKIAVILFNLGGPNSLEEVQPFLFNLFNDKAIISLPQPFRKLLASFIAGKRASYAKEIYKKIGGKSPLLENTIKQANALEKSLNSKEIAKFKCFIAMRYAKPFVGDIISDVIEYNPDQVILLPLYPQYSTTTTASSLNNWYSVCKGNNFSVPTETICCYAGEANFIKGHIDLIKKSIKKITSKKFRILFSAHGLPKKIIKKGDPYEWQINHTMESIVSNLTIDNLDYKICYQSKVGN